MRAMILNKIVSLAENPEPLELVDLPIPQPKDKQVLLRVRACGVCHTELDEIEGRTAPPRLPIVPGHEVVGIVEQVGSSVSMLNPGDRVGVGWIHSSSGKPNENLSEAFRATGRDTHGGYAEFMIAHENYAYPIPDIYSDIEAAPLLCAGAVGYRALKLTNLVDGESLGLTGFGGSAHLVLQMVRHRFPNSEIHVFARDEAERAFARELGAAWAGDTVDSSPRKLHAIIDTTPAWKPVICALANLRPGGRLVINAIRKQNADIESLLNLNYHEHLWMERSIKTVANVTSFDLREFLPLAAEIPIRPTVRAYRLEDANKALCSLRQGRVIGAKVLIIN